MQLLGPGPGSNGISWDERQHANDHTSPTNLQIIIILIVVVFRGTCDSEPIQRSLKDQVAATNPVDRG